MFNDYVRVRLNEMTHGGEYGHCAHIIHLIFSIGFGGMRNIQPYSPTGSNCAAEWTAWLQWFGFFMQAMPDLDGQLDWCALLLDCGGPRLRQVHLSLESDTLE